MPGSLLFNNGKPWIKRDLDVTFDLGNGKSKPYRKPNDDPLYIDRHSNHPPSIIKQGRSLSHGKTINLCSYIKHSMCMLKDSELSFALFV